MDKRPLSDVPTSELPALVEQGMPVLDYVQEVKRRDECQDKQHSVVKPGLLPGLVWVALLAWSGVILTALVYVWESNESLFTRLAAATLVIFVAGAVSLSMVGADDED